MEIKIKLLPGGKMPTKAHRTDAAWDTLKTNRRVAP